MIDTYTYNSVDGSGVGDTVTQHTPSDGALSVDGGNPEVGDRIAFADCAGRLCLRRCVYRHGDR